MSVSRIITVPVLLGFLFFGEMREMILSGLNRKSGMGAGWIVACVLAVFFALSPAHAAQSTSASTTKKSTASKKHTRHKASATSASSRSTSRKSSRGKKSKRVRGQQIIDPNRAQAIQEALIREHYLSGEPTGTWNADSEAAMRRFQADNGWQSKTVPDSRALIKLGLGPSKDHLLNPESAMTTIPEPPKSIPVAPTSHSPSPVANPASPSPTPAPSSSTPTPASTSAASGSSEPQ